MEKRNQRDESPAAAGFGSGAPKPPTAEDPVEEQLAKIRAMDPEMSDLGAILGSQAGEKFREYVALGLDFVDAYTLAAREKLQALRDRHTAEALRARAAGKDHLSATSTRGQEGVSIPKTELAIIRALLPDATDEEIRRDYRADKKRFGR